MDKKTVLITGATGVIGANIAKHFYDSGYRLILSGRQTEKLNELKNNFGDDVLICPADVADIESVKNLFSLIEREIGSLDVVISAAGIYGEIGRLEQVDMEKWEDAFRVNVFGSMYVAKFAIPLLKKSNNASIILFAGGGEGPLPNFSSYASSKGAILRFAETLAEEVKEYGIKVNAIYPGLVNSGFVKNIIDTGPQRAGRESYEQALRQVDGEEKTVTPDRAAQLCIFLASKKAKGITGKLFAARWDQLDNIEKHKEDIMNTDIYSSRRIKPYDRGRKW